MNVFLKSGKICAVTLETKNAYTKTYRRRIPSSKVMTIPIEMRDLREQTERNIIPFFQFRNQYMLLVNQNDTMNLLIILFCHMQTVNVKSLGDSPYLISMEPEDLIGKGSYACVAKAFNKDDQDEKLAAKTFDLSDSKKFESAMKELMVVSKIPNHENLVEYRKVKITSKNRLYIIMQLCRQSLQNKLERQQGMEQQQIWRLINQFCAGYKVLQQKCISHRDIKPDNILIGYDNNYKISDFGLSDVISQIEQNDQKFKKPKGSLPFMAPQMLFDYPQHSNGFMPDVYSFGVTLYYVCFLKYPYISTSPQKSRHYKKKSFPVSIHDFLKQLKNNTLVFPSRNYSDKLLSLISSCLEKNPRERCSWEFIYFSAQSQVKQELINLRDHNKNLDESQKNKLFRIVEISDTFLKNLSTLDADLFCSLTNQSVILIDHIQATIISKRQVIYFCDRLYYRLTILHERRIDKVPKPKLIEDFCQNLLTLNYINCLKLDAQFERYYLVINKNQYIKCLTSQKYICLRNLIRQDLQFISSTLSELKQSTLRGVNLELNEFTAKVYEKCSCMVELLYQMGLYEQCKQVDELEKYLEGREDSILKKLRKNENALTQFDHSIRSISKNRLKQIISKQYMCPFKKIDHQ